MSSGVTVSQECQDAFQQLKLGKKTKFIIFKISDDYKEFVVEKTSESAEYDEFLNSFPELSPRFGVYDFEYEIPGEGKRNKICFISWAPDESKIKDKMIYASSREALRRAVVGIGAEIQGTDFDEVSYDQVLQKVLRK
ncbi:hypothetical protein JCM6882_003278 [Rhodosporidiobolus microsporus]